MCDLARDMNPAMRVVEITDFTGWPWRQGQKDAVVMIEGTARHIAKPKFAKAARVERVN